MNVRTERSARWHGLGPLDRVPPGEGRRFNIEGAQVAVFRARSGHVFAVDASCPHQGGPLEDGLLGNGAVTCPLHGFKFDLATGRALGHDCGRLKTYVVRVNDAGELFIARHEAEAPVAAGAAR